MKAGDYVRTKYGEICKLKLSKFSYLLYETDIEIDRHNDRDCNDFGFDSDTINDIVKSSPNIIDLIEVRDIIKGKDEHLFEVYAVGSDCVYINNLEEFILADEIKSIITHEQIESMEYKICTK